MNPSLRRFTLTAAAPIIWCASFSIAAPPVLERGDSRDWILSIKVDAQSTPARRYLNDASTPGFQVSTSFDITQAAWVYPAIESSAAHESFLERATSSLKVDDVLFDDTVTLLPNYQAGEQLGRWELPALRGNLIRFRFNVPMTCFDVSFDEARAFAIPWPTEAWSPIAASALQPQLFVESDDEYIKNLVRTWTNNNPGAVPPARLAKILCKRVLEHVRIVTDIGYVSGRHGEFAGLAARGASYSARSQEATPTDIAALLCAVYRAAGLPARIVVGYDLAASLGVQLGIPNIDPVCMHNANDDGRAFPIVRTWVEFYLFDEVEQRAEWIPVDIFRQSQISSKPPELDRRWDFFGNHPCLAHMAPLSFHLHPPTTVINSGPPAIWGWLPQPAAPALDQRLDFEAREPTTRGGDRD